MICTTYNKDGQMCKELFLAIKFAEEAEKTGLPTMLDENEFYQLKDK